MKKHGVTWSESQLRDYLRRTGPNSALDGSPAAVTRSEEKKPVATNVAARHPKGITNETSANGKISNTQPERDKASALGRPISRKAKGDGRTVVRFTGYRVRPLDPDNFAGSVKDLLDGLRHASLLDGDEPWRIILETKQVKVARYDQEKTVVEIIT